MGIRRQEVRRRSGRWPGCGPPQPRPPPTRDRNCTVRPAPFLPCGATVKTPPPTRAAARSDPDAGRAGRRAYRIRRCAAHLRPGISVHHRADIGREGDRFRHRTMCHPHPFRPSDELTLCAGALSWISCTDSPEDFPLWQRAAGADVLQTTGEGQVRPPNCDRRLLCAVGSQLAKA